MPEDDLRVIINDTYAVFSHPEVAPLKTLNDNEYVLELFHGPTLAFKDFALQLLGRLLDYFLARRKRHVAILGATSGDTGSAALEGCRHCEWVDMYILYPHNRVSEVQRRQMTTVPGDNVNSLAIEGNFDDCQNIVKQAFADQGFLPKGYQLVAVNSINFSRIMAQIVYYFYAALKITGGEKPVSFSVPTGNFGDIYAGYLAKKMGLPVDRLIIALAIAGMFLMSFVQGIWLKKLKLWITCDSICFRSLSSRLPLGIERKRTSSEVSSERASPVQSLNSTAARSSRRWKLPSGRTVGSLHFMTNSKNSSISRTRSASSPSRLSWEARNSSRPFSSR
jgi:threonine synthase